MPDAVLRSQARVLPQNVYTAVILIFLHGRSEEEGVGSASVVTFWPIVLTISTSHICHSSKDLFTGCLMLRVNSRLRGFGIMAALRGSRICYRHHEGPSWTCTSGYKCLAAPEFARLKLRRRVEVLDLPSDFYSAEPEANSPCAVHEPEMGIGPHGTREFFYAPWLATTVFI